MALLPEFADSIKILQDKGVPVSLEANENGATLSISSMQYDIRASGKHEITVKNSASTPFRYRLQEHFKLNAPGRSIIDDIVCVAALERIDQEATKVYASLPRKLRS